MPLRPTACRAVHAVSIRSQEPGFQHTSIAKTFLIRPGSAYDGRVRSTGRADALLVMAQTAASAGAPAGKPRPVLTVTTDHAALTGQLTAMGRLDTGKPITPAAARRIGTLTPPPWIDPDQTPRRHHRYQLRQLNSTCPAKTHPNSRTREARLERRRRDDAGAARLQPGTAAGHR